MGGGHNITMVNVKRLEFASITKEMTFKNLLIRNNNIRCRDFDSKVQGFTSSSVSVFFKKLLYWLPMMRLEAVYPKFACAGQKKSVFCEKSGCFRKL